MQNDKSKIVDHESPSEIYKLAVKIRKAFNKTFSEKSRRLSGNMFIATVAITLVCMFLYPIVFNGESIDFIGLFLVTGLIAVLSFLHYILCKEKNEKCRRFTRFFIHSVATFSISYGYVALLIVVAYFLAVRIGFLNLDPAGKMFPVDDVYILFLIFAISMLAASLAFEPTSLMIRGYMKRYDKRWKDYSHSIFYIIFLAGLCLFVILSTGFELITHELNRRLQEYLRIRWTTNFTIIAYIIHLCFMLYAQYKIEEKIFGHLDV